MPNSHHCQKIDLSDCLNTVVRPLTPKGKVRDYNHLGRDISPKLMSMNTIVFPLDNRLTERGLKWTENVWMVLGLLLISFAS